MPSVVANDRESTHEAHRPHYTILNHVDCVSQECQFTADVCSFLLAQGRGWQEERLTVRTRDEGSIRFELYAGNGANGNIALDDIVLQFGPCDAIDKCERTCRNVTVPLVKLSIITITWVHPELLTFGETRNNWLNTFVPLYTLGLRSMIPQNIDFKSNANMNA